MKTESYCEFRDKIHKIAKNKGFPLRVMFELTYRCNFRCRHCYVPNSYRKAKELKTKDIYSILDQLKDIGCFYLGFTGGEPFLREDIMDILWYARKNGFEVIIYTNGSLIDEGKIDELAQLRPNKIDITIPAMSKDAFERISGVSGYRDRVFKTIDLLHKKRINLGFKSYLLKENESEIKDIQDFARFLGIVLRVGAMLSPRLDGSKQPYRYGSQFMGSNKQRRDDIKQWDFEACQSTIAGDSLHAADIFKCGVGMTQAAITPLGELKMCLMIDYPKYKIADARQGRQGRGKKANLKDAWRDLRELVASIKPDRDYKCDGSELAPFRFRCPARGWLENKNFFGCVPEVKR